MDDKKLPDVIAVLDQFGVQVENMAVIVRSYFVKLKESGFSEPRAWELTKDFNKVLWDQMFSANRPNITNCNLTSNNEP